MQAVVCISFQIMLCTFFRSMKGFSHRGMGLGAWSMGHGVNEFGNSEWRMRKNRATRYVFRVVGCN